MAQPIAFYSTNGHPTPYTFSEALIKGQAPDKGLFMPETIPQLTIDEIEEFSSLEYPEIAFRVASRFLVGEIENEELLRICKEAYNFPVPLEKVTANYYVMRLDQGPTASFKDFAARMMGRLMQYYLKKNNRRMLILTATSGDTGSAIANSFYNLNNIKVVVLFPEKEVTTRQRKQMTTLGKNIQILALNAKFDDCQALVKQAFADPELEYLNLSSANSINIGRLIPQIVYYFYSYSRLRKSKGESVVFSVPSGNFGDMMGGVFAYKMGLPVKKFVIATNENDEFPKFLESGVYNKIEPSRNCISSAMNVGHPSNLARLIHLYGGQMDEKGIIHKNPDLQAMQRDIFSTSVTDDETRATIKRVWEQHKVLLEPHGAVGWEGLERYIRQFNESAEQLCISLETAHPAKFPQEINQILGIDPELPPSLKGIEEKDESFVRINNDYKEFKEFLKYNYV